jgi:hypothetical protein
MKKSLIFANLILGGLTVFSISIALYAIYRMASLYGFESGIHLAFLFVSLIGAGVGLYGFRLKAQTRINLSLLIFSVVIGIYGIELGLFLLEGYDEKVQAARHMGIEFDRRTIYEVLQDFRDEGVEAYPTIQYRSVDKDDDLYREISPLWGYPPPFVTLSGGISNKVIVFCNETGSWKSYKADRYGFYNPDRVWDESEIDIVLVGDSFAHGYCVAEGDDIAGTFRDRGYRALNLSEGGNGPLVELASIKEYAVAKKFGCTSRGMISLI